MSLIINPYRFTSLTPTTWDPGHVGGNWVLSGDNLIASHKGAAGGGNVISVLGKDTDFYFEIVSTGNTGTQDTGIGVTKNTIPVSNSLATGSTDYATGYRGGTNGIIQNHTGTITSGLTGALINEVVGVWCKPASNQCLWYVEGSLETTETIAASTTWYAILTREGGTTSPDHINTARFDPASWTNKPAGVTNDMALTS